MGTVQRDVKGFKNVLFQFQLNVENKHENPTNTCYFLAILILKSKTLINNISKYLDKSTS